MSIKMKKFLTKLFNFSACVSKQNEFDRTFIYNVLFPARDNYIRTLRSDKENRPVSN